MDPKLYNALANGDVDALKQQFKLLLHLQTTHQKCTALHIAVQFEQESCVRTVLSLCPSTLLLNVNTRGDTALHIAARQGLRRIVKCLVDKATNLGAEDVEYGGTESIVRQLIKMPNKNRDTALHEAARGSDLEVVKHLIEAYPEFEYLPNYKGETPLYLAAVHGGGWHWYDSMELILETCPLAAHGGPEGKTALHAVVLGPGILKKDAITHLLRVKPSINKEADKYGWTPLHYAASIRFSSADVCQWLVEADTTVPYILDKKGMSALHVAAGQENEKAIEMILKYCPDCWELLDHKGRNYLHVAALRGQMRVLKSILQVDHLTKECINQSDNDGNTPLHLAAINEAYCFVLLLSKDGRVNNGALNNEHLNALHILEKKDLHERANLREEWLAAKNSVRDSIRGLVSHISWVDLGIPKTENEKYGRREQKIIEKMQKASANHLVVAALIATVTFAASFALPGGYESDGTNKGMAVLIGKTMFKVFAISNTIAMVLSTLAVLTHFFMNLADDGYSSVFLKSAFFCTFFAILSMMLAFITGTYSVLAHSHALAITTCVIGCSFYLFCYYPIRYSLKSKIMREFIFHPIFVSLISLDQLFGNRLVPMRLIVNVLDNYYN